MLLVPASSLTSARHVTTKVAPARCGIRYQSQSPGSCTRSQPKSLMSNWVRTSSIEGGIASCKALRRMFTSASENT